MGQRTKVTLVLVSIFLIQLYCTWGSEISKYYYTSTYGVLCSDACERRGEDYYWCHTGKGWDTCSPQENTDYKGNKCRDDHPCGKYGESYYWCKRKIGSWDQCGKVEPKTMLYISSTYQSVCIDACVYYSDENYYWCNTEKGWDYCSPQPGVTYRNEPCRSDYPCGTYGEEYTWCRTGWFSYGYCSLIRPNECRYVTSSRKRRELNNLILICTRTDKGNKKETKFYAEPNPTAIADVGARRNEITNLISRWNDGYLCNQARSELITSEHLRIDLQGIVNRNNQPYYNLQIQINTHRIPGSSTTVAQVLLPQNEDVPDRYVRMAFTESFRRRARVFVEVSHGNIPVRCGQNYG